MHKYTHLMSQIMKRYRFRTCNAKAYSIFYVDRQYHLINVQKMLTDCIDVSCSCTGKAHILFYATLEFREDLIRNNNFMTISIFAFKGELNGKILLVCFYFVVYR